MSTDSFRRHARVRADAAVRRLFSHREAFVRDPFPFIRPTGHPLVAIHAIADHCFGLYATPRFLASAWLTDNLDHQRWFIALAQGASVKSLALPIALTHRMAHLFLATPDHYSIEHALRRAELVGLGASPALVAILLTTRLGATLADWRRQLTWLVGLDDLELDQVGPVIDFLGAHRDLDLRGRTFVSTRRLVEAWHAELMKQKRRLITWLPSHRRGLTRVVPPTRDEPRGTEWVIHELTDSHQLWREGRDMRHCVGSYARLVVKGRCRIWSLRRRYLDDEHFCSIATVEVQGAYIRQIKGPANARASPRAFDLVCEWASREGLTLASSLKRIGG